MYCRFNLMTSVPPGEEGRPLGGKLCRDWLAGEEVGPAPQGRLGLASLPPAFQASHATLLPSTHRKDVSAVRCPVLPVNVAPWRGRPQAAPFPMMAVPPLPEYGPSSDTHHLPFLFPPISAQLCVISHLCSTHMPHFGQRSGNSKHRHSLHPMPGILRQRAGMDESLAKSEPCFSPLCGRSET